MMTVYDVIQRLDGVRGMPPKCRARCPACSRRGALSIGEGDDGRVLARCFAGCELHDITCAIGLAVSDLSRRRPWRDRVRQRLDFAKAPQRTVREALTRELDRLRERLRAENGYDRPIRSNDINAVRARVARIYEVELAPVSPKSWECPPHDDDPAWPTLYARALEEETRRRWMALHPDAAPWETDPDGPGSYDHLRAERLARDWQRGMAS